MEETGPTGNKDALKLSGVRDFTVRASRFSGWGGSAIDMVACSEGLIESCRFEENVAADGGGVTPVLLAVGTGLIGLGAAVVALMVRSAAR